MKSGNIYVVCVRRLLLAGTKRNHANLAFPEETERLLRAD